MNDEYPSWLYIGLLPTTIFDSAQNKDWILENVKGSREENGHVYLPKSLEAGLKYSITDDGRIYTMIPANGLYYPFYVDLESDDSKQALVDAINFYYKDPEALPEVTVTAPYNLNKYANQPDALRVQNNTRNKFYTSDALIAKPEPSEKPKEDFEKPYSNAFNVNKELQMESAREADKTRERLKNTSYLDASDILNLGLPVNWNPFNIFNFSKQGINKNYLGMLDLAFLAATVGSGNILTGLPTKLWMLEGVGERAYDRFFNNRSQPQLQQPLEEEEGLFDDIEDYNAE